MRFPGLHKKFQGFSRVSRDFQGFKNFPGFSRISRACTNPVRCCNSSASGCGVNFRSGQFSAAISLFWHFSKLQLQLGEHNFPADLHGQTPRPFFQAHFILQSQIILAVCVASHMATLNFDFLTWCLHSSHLRLRRGFRQETAYLCTNIKYKSSQSKILKTKLLGNGKRFQIDILWNYIVFPGIYVKQCFISHTWKILTETCENSILE